MFEQILILYFSLLGFKGSKDNTLVPLRKNGNLSDSKTLRSTLRSEIKKICLVDLR